MSDYLIGFINSVCDLPFAGIDPDQALPYLRTLDFGF